VPDQPTFGRRTTAPSPAPRSFAASLRPAPTRTRPAPNRAALGLDKAWTSDGSVKAWKSERRQKMALAMGWRRWAYVACILLGLTVRTLQHGLVAQLIGFGLSATGFALLWAGRRRYADSIAPSAPGS
jgi:hypothetical protein